MSAPTILGLNGRMGSGKDTVFERLDTLYPGRFVQRSYAAPLKAFAAAIIDVSVEQLEEWKRDESVGVQIVDEHRGGLDSPMTIRTFLQRVGTEGGRETFGDDFWIRMGMESINDLLPEDWQAKRIKGAPIPVFTDVRFSNEAAAIIDRGGEVWKVIGPDEETGDHASEAGIHSGYVERWVNNRTRDDEFSMLDSQIRQIVDTWGFQS